MKYYQISFPGEFGQHVDEIWSEKQILKAYYPYWCGMMIQNRAAPDLNPVTCIDDWCVTHWAVEVPKPGWITEAADLMSDKGYETAPLNNAPRFDQHYDMDKVFHNILKKRRVDK